MRNTRFAQTAVQAYERAPEVASAEVYTEGTTRPLGIRIRLRNGLTVHHAVTMVTPEGEDLEQPEEPVEGPPPAPLDARPQPTGAQAQETAQLLAAILADSQNPEMKEVYAYGRNMHPGIGVLWHSGRKTHMLLLDPN